MISAHIYEENAEAAGAAQEFQCESLVVPIAAAICTCRSVKALAKKRWINFKLHDDSTQIVWGLGPGVSE